MSDPQRVVYDCNIFLQALAKPTGPAGECVSLALDGKVALFISEIVLDEIRDVPSRPELVRRFKLNPDRVRTLIDNLRSAAVLLTQIPELWTYERDPDDAHYVNLALAADLCHGTVICWICLTSIDPRRARLIHSSRTSESLILSHSSVT